MNATRVWSILRWLVLALTMTGPLGAAAAQQDTFATPEAAADALMAAFKADSDATMVAIFGEEHKDLILQTDRAATSATRTRLFDAMQTLRVLRTAGPDRRVLVIGAEAWPLPIPIVRAGDRWRFATEEGREEIVNRRVGSNERNAIDVLRAYLDAQRAYASRDRDGTASSSMRRGSPARRASGTASIGRRTTHEARKRVPSGHWWPPTARTSRAGDAWRAMRTVATTSAS